MACSKAIRAACKQEAFSFRDLETQVPVPHSGTVGFLAELSLSSGYRDGGTLARQGANLPQEGSDFCGSSFLRVNAQLLLRSTLRVSLRVDLPRSLEQAQPGALRKGPSPPSPPQAGPMHGGSMEGLGSPSTGSLDRSQGLRAERSPQPWDFAVVMCTCWPFV